VVGLLEGLCLGRQVFQSFPQAWKPRTKKLNWERIPSKLKQQARKGKKQLTFDLFPLRFKGLARVLRRLLQAENRGFLLLEGLVQILVRDAELVELPVEPRDFFVPLLEGCLRPLECDALLLESALGLLLRQALVLESGPSLSKGSPLLLELSVRLLARVPLPLKLLLHRGE
jgi:hypothetical protein